MTDETTTSGSDLEDGVGTGTRNRLIEWTQAYLAVMVPSAAIGLIFLDRALPDWLTLSVGMVLGFFFQKRAQLNGKS